MSKALTILKNDPSFPSYLDFDKLREEGIKHIASLSGDIWTDHNVHDPGITILEVLCYALTDLGYRINLDIKDLLALNAKEGEREDNFFTPAEILTCNPTTLNDYRKLLIDIEGVRSAWLEVAGEGEIPLFVDCDEQELRYSGHPEKEIKINGLYKVLIETDFVLPGKKGLDACGKEILPTDKIINEVKNTLNAHRNLCEDFLDIIVLQNEEIGICADIELEPNSDPEVAILEAFTYVQDFLSPTLNFYTLHELLDKGKRIEEIFEGRPLSKTSHGFIDTTELENFDRKREIHVSDLMREMLKSKGIRAVSNLLIFNYIDGVKQSLGEKWCLKITDNYRPVLSADLSNLRFYKGDLPFSVNLTTVSERLKKRLANYQKAIKDPSDLDLEVPAGKYREDLKDYYSIQNEFPVVYGIGEDQLPDNVSTKRKAQALQLKGYLTFYDQFLTNFLMQLGNVRKMFSLKPDEKRDEANNRTYFNQELSTVPELEKLIRFNQNGSVMAEEVYAVSNRFYSTSLERNQAIERIIWGVENNVYKIVLQFDNGRFGLILIDEFNKVLLKSKLDFATEKEAESKIELFRFLLSFSENFKNLNNAAEANYSFSVIYNPIQYLTYLNRISENSTSYFQRRNRFLNHLLSRFSEDFTDYVLLMYALNKERYTSDKILNHKAKFLSNYPRISSNRGRGFNYSDKSNIWNTNNVSGLEERVAYLMGIEGWKRKHLNNFEPAKVNSQEHLILKSHWEEVWFKEIKSCNLPPLNEDKIKDIAHDKDNYLPFYCEVEKVYGFKLKDKKDRLIAIHPSTYGTKDARDHKLESIRKSFIKSEVRKAIPTNQGFYILIFDDEKNTLLKSVKAYSSVEESEKDWLLLLDLLKDGSNYQDVEGEPGQFNFGVGYWESGIWNELARYPEMFSSKAERTKIKKKSIGFFKNKIIQHSILSNPISFKWLLNDNQNNTWIIKSIHSFKNGNQTASAWRQFIEYGKHDNNYKNVSTELGFGFEVFKEQNLPLAKSNWYKTELERDEARINTQKIINDDPLQNTFTHLERGFKYELKDDKDNVLLRSTHIFWNRAEAEEGLHELKDLAIEKNNFQIVKNEDEDDFVLRLIESGKTAVAQAPKRFGSLEDAESYVEKIVAFVNNNQIFYADKVIKDCYGFNIDNAYLKSKYVYRSEDRVLAVFWKVMFHGKDKNKFELKNKKNNYGFEIKTKRGEIVGKNNVEFKSKEERDNGLNDGISYFQSHKSPVEKIRKNKEFRYELLDPSRQVSWLKGIENFSNEEKAKLSLFGSLEFACDIENYKKIKSEDGCRFGFSLLRDNEIIARHPSLYLSEKERDDAILKIVDHISKNKIKWKVEELPGTWNFNLCWEGCSGKFELFLEGTKTYDLECDALNDAEELVKKINDKQAKVHIYDPSEDDRSFKFDVLVRIQDGEVRREIRASHPKRYPDKNKVDKVWLAAETFFANNYNLGIKRDEVFGSCEGVGGSVFGSNGYFFRPVEFDIYNRDYIGVHCEYYSKKEDRNVAYDQLIKSKPNWRIEHEKTGGFFRLMVYSKLDDEVEKLIFKGTRCYTCMEELEEDTTSTLLEKPILLVNDLHSNHYSMVLSDAKLKYQLANQNWPLAIHPYQYQNKCERDKQLQITENAFCSGWPFLKIRLLCTIKRVKGKYHFGLVDSSYLDDPLWISFKGYQSKEEAEEGFELLFKLIISSSCVRDNYNLINDEIVLKNNKGDIIAKIPGSYIGCSVEDEAIKLRVNYGKYFPIKWVNNKYFFELVKFEGRKIFWKSASNFNSYEETVLAFNHFLNCLKHKGGYRKIDDKATCNFSFEYREVLLESNLEYFSKELEPNWKEEQECIPYLWDGVKELLRHVQNDYAIYPYVNYQKNCENSFKIVTDTYRIARHSQSYLTKEERENVRDRLFHLAECNKWYCSQISLNPCFKKDESDKDNPDEKKGLYFLLINHSGDNGIYDLLDNFYDEELKSPIWKGVKGRKDWNIDEFRIEAIRIMARATKDKAYSYIENEDGSFRLLLLDEKGDLLATSYHKYLTKESLEKAKNLRLLQAIYFPFYLDEKTEKFGFKLRQIKIIKSEIEKVDIVDCSNKKIWESQLVVSGIDIWESNKTYGAYIDAEVAFANFKNLLKTKTNYGRLDQSGCGPFSIELLDNEASPSLVLANHPHSYKTYDEMEIAISKTMELLNSEGFHLLEHTLLRPKEESTLLMPICPDCSASVGVEKLESSIDPCKSFKEEEFDEVMYIPGGDPYSFWATIVLPYWPKRFQNTNFRSFFEDTLRRETPSHISLRIGWISPEQMREFELRYKDWLKVYGDRNNCNLLESQNNLINYLSKLNNVYPPAIFPTGNGEDSEELIILGEVKLD